MTGFIVVAKSKPCQISEMEFFIKTVNDIKYFRKKHYLRSLAGFVIHLWG